MIELFSFWFWLSLVAAIVVLLAAVDAVEETRAFHEARRQRRIDRETESTLRRMEQLDRARLELASKTETDVTNLRQYRMGKR